MFQQSSICSLPRYAKYISWLTTLFVDTAQNTFEWRHTYPLQIIIDICVVRRKHNPVLISLFMTYHQIFYMSDTPVSSGVRVGQSLVFYLVFYEPLCCLFFSFLSLSFCFACLSVYGLCDYLFDIFKLCFAHQSELFNSLYMYMYVILHLHHKRCISQ